MAPTAAITAVLIISALVMLVSNAVKNPPALLHLAAPNRYSLFIKTGFKSVKIPAFTDIKEAGY